MSQQQTQRRATGSGMERFNSIRPGTNISYSALFILLAFLCVIPVIYVIVVSFLKWNGISTATFADVQNFLKLFRDKSFQAECSRCLAYKA